ncbi:hypothetical protein ACFQZC_06120 [Streptacidiphilus monticola]
MPSSAAPSSCWSRWRSARRCCANCAASSNSRPSRASIPRRRNALRNCCCSRGVRGSGHGSRRGRGDPAARGAEPAAGAGFGWAAWWALGLRAARLLGLLTQDQARSRWAQVGSWLFLGVVFLAGLVAPLVWLPYMAWSYDRATRRLLDQAAAFYLGVPEVTAEGEALERPTPQGRRRVDPALVGGLVRGLGSLLVGLALVAFTVLADLTLLGSRWPVLALLLAVSSGLTGVLWLWRHGGWRRRRR